MPSLTSDLVSLYSPNIAMDLNDEVVLPKCPSLLGSRRHCINQESDNLPRTEKPVSTNAEEEAEEDEVLSESEYGDDFESSESEDDYRTDDSQTVSTPTTNRDEKKRLRLRGSNERDMKKGMDGDFLFTTNSTPWSFDLVIPFGEKPLVRRFCLPLSKSNLHFISSRIGNDWAWKAMDAEGFRAFAHHFRFRGKSKKEQCLFGLTKARMMETQQMALTKFPSACLEDIDGGAPNVHLTPKMRKCKRRLFNDDDEAPAKKRMHCDD